MSLRQSNILKLCGHRQALIIRHEHCTSYDPKRPRHFAKATDRRFLNANIDLPKALQSCAPDEQRLLHHFLAKVIEELVEFPIAIDEGRVRCRNDNREKTRIVGYVEHSDNLAAKWLSGSIGAGRVITVAGFSRDRGAPVG